MWGTKRNVPTSGITQPPIAGFAVKRLFDTAKDKALAEKRARDLLPKIDHWHQWFYENRDPGKTDLVALIHPWESGRDNSIDWDAAFKRIPTDGVAPYTRRDTQHADPSHRPTKDQYDRYIWLVERFRSPEWDNAVLHDASPFQMVDPGFNAILIRSCADLAALAQSLGESEIADRNNRRAENGLAAMDHLWNEKLGQYVCFDRAANRHVDSASIAGLIPILVSLPKHRADALVDTLIDLGKSTRFLVPSHDPSDHRFDTKRYWRGPVWLIINYLITDGLRNSGYDDMAKQIETASLELISTGGFAEYYDPISGEPCGGASFTWTAAMVMEFLGRAA